MLRACNVARWSEHRRVEDQHSRQVADMKLPRRAFLARSVTGAALAALVRSQIPAAAATALFRNHEAFAESMTRTTYPIVELRQYTLLPNRFEPFAALFEREFIETQEVTGAKVIGQFHDLDDPNRFVWLRGFTDMDARARQLQEFYGGPVWKAHRDEANVNFTDTDNVLLLHTARPQSGFALARAKRAPMGATQSPHGLLVATIYAFDEPVNDDFVQFFEQKLTPALHKAGINPIAYVRTEESPNNFPRLPVREHEHVFVWFVLFDDAADHRRRTAALDASPNWRDWISQDLRHRLKSDPQTLRLAPTPRSLLHL
jgi:hypothetical protein